MQERENNAAIEVIRCPIESSERIEKRSSGESSGESSGMRAAQTSVSLRSILFIPHRVYNIFFRTQNEIWDNTALQLTSQREKPLQYAAAGERRHGAGKRWKTGNGRWFESTLGNQRGLTREMDSKGEGVG
jgi:hypothetical protein